MSDKIILRFTQGDKALPVLEETHFYTGKLPPIVAFWVPDKSQDGFTWDLVEASNVEAESDQIQQSNTAVFVLALLRTARFKHYTLPLDKDGNKPDQVPIIGKEMNGFAERLNSLKFHPPKWLRWMLKGNSTSAPDPKQTMRSWFHVATDSDGRTSGFAKLLGLQPESIEVFINGIPANEENLDRLDATISVSIKGGHPPLPVEMFGDPPPVGRDCFGREGELNQMDLWKSDPSVRFVEIVGNGGSGKTTLAMSWFLKQIKKGHLNNSKIISWAFPRKDIADKTRPSPRAFYEELAKAFGFTIPANTEGKLLGTTLAEQAKKQRHFILIDGIDVLLNHLGGFKLGGNRAVDETISFNDPSMQALLGMLAGASQPCDCLVLVTTQSSVARILPPSDSVKSLALTPYERSKYEKNSLSVYFAKDSSQIPQLKGIDYQPQFPLSLEDLWESWRKKEGILDPRRITENKERYFVHCQMEDLTKPALCLLFASSMFDREVDWDDLFHLLMEAPSKQNETTRTQAWTAFVAPFQHLTRKAWKTVSIELEKTGLAYQTMKDSVALVPYAHSIIADTFRDAKLEVWAAGHRRLYFHFGRKSPHKPDSITQMAPLFRALWHGCQAGDFNDAFNKIAFERISRGGEAYIVNGLGEYEAAISVLSTFTNDGENFPATDLDRENRVRVIHGCALCLRFTGKLEESIRLEQIAWEKAMAHPPLNTLLPITVNLLRIQQQFGLLEDSRKVLDSVFQSFLLALKEKSAEIVDPKYVPQAFGYCSSVIGLTRIYRGENFRVHPPFCIGTPYILFKSERVRTLAPGLGAPFHALALLELGQWQKVDRAIKQGELDLSERRYELNGTIDYIAGRVAGIAAKTAGERDASIKILEKASEAAHRCNLDWWHLTSKLEIGRVHLASDNLPLAEQLFSYVLEIADARKYALLQVDALLGRARTLMKLHALTAAKRDLHDAEARIQRCGYKLRSKEVKSMLRSLK